MSDFWTYFLIIALWWTHRLLYQYSHHRTESFYLFKITWQQISAGACMSPEWSNRPARHFILHLLGLRAVEVFKSDAGLSVRFMQFQLFGYILNQHSKTTTVEILEVEFTLNWKRDIVPPIERLSNV